MRAQSDFHLTIDRAAGLALDATCSARAAGALPLPAPHRRLVNEAIVALEKAQQRFFQASNSPWDPPPRPQNPQLELL